MNRRTSEIEITEIEKAEIEKKRGEDTYRERDRKKEGER